MFISKVFSSHYKKPSPSLFLSVLTKKLARKKNFSLTWKTPLIRGVFIFIKSNTISLYQMIFRNVHFIIFDFVLFPSELLYQQNEHYRPTEQIPHHHGCPKHLTPPRTFNSTQKRMSPYLRFFLTAIKNAINNTFTPTIKEINNQFTPVSLLTLYTFDSSRFKTR